MRLTKLRTSIILSVFAIVILGWFGYKNIQVKRTEQERKEIYRIEKLIADDTAKKYVGINKITFTDYDFSSDGSGYIGFGITINNKKRDYTITYSNDTDFGESGYGDQVIDNFYKINTNKYVGLNNVKNLKIKYFFDKSK